jgi:hypothetical protein
VVKFGQHSKCWVMCQTVVKPCPTWRIPSPGIWHIVSLVSTAVSEERENLKSYMSNMILDKHPESVWSAQYWPPHHLK